MMPFFISTRKNFRLKLFHLIVPILILIVGLSGCMSVGKLIGNLMTQKVDRLDNAAIQVYYFKNLHSPSIKTADNSVLGDIWFEGKNMVILSVLKHEGTGFYEIDGSVELNGEPLNSLGFGVYGKSIEVNDNQEKVFNITTKSGETASIKVSPIPPVKILAVNGRSHDIEVNQESDLVLELASEDNAENTWIKVAFLNTPSFGTSDLTQWNEIYHARSSEKIIVPAAAFKHPGAPADGGGDYAGGILKVNNLNDGETYMMVERYLVNTSPVNGTTALQVVSKSLDVVPVKLSSSPERINELVVEGTTDGTNYKLTKRNGFIGRSLQSASGKKFALSSFVVRGTMSSSTISHSDENATVYKSCTFPTLPAEYWDKYLSDSYEKIITTIKTQLNINLIPVEEVLKAPSYQLLECIKDTAIKVEFSRSYKGTKDLTPPTGLALIPYLMKTASTFASDKIESRLCRELGVDGIISITLELTCAAEDCSLTPNLIFKISGPPNGYQEGPTVYAQGIVSGSGVPFDDAKAAANSISDFLNKVSKTNSIAAALEQALKVQKIKEQELGYADVWRGK
jgi:hypothetical protein